MRYSPLFVMNLIDNTVHGDTVLNALTIFACTLSLFILAIVGGFVRSWVYPNLAFRVRPLATDVVLGLIITFFWAAARSCVANLFKLPGYFEGELLLVTSAIGALWQREALARAFDFKSPLTLSYAALTILGCVAYPAYRFWPSLFSESSDPAVLSAYVDSFRLLGKVTNVSSSLNDIPITYPLGIQMLAAALGNPLFLSNSLVHGWPSINATLAPLLIFDAWIAHRRDATEAFTPKRLLLALLMVVVWRLTAGSVDVSPHVGGIVKRSQAVFIAFFFVAALAARWGIVQGQLTTKRAAWVVSFAILAAAIPCLVNPANAFIAFLLMFILCILMASTSALRTSLFVGSALVLLPCILYIIQDTQVLMIEGARKILCQGFGDSFKLCSWPEERFELFAERTRQFVEGYRHPPWEAIDPFRNVSFFRLTHVLQEDGRFKASFVDNLMVLGALAGFISLCTFSDRRRWISLLKVGGMVLGLIVLSFLLMEGQAFLLWKAAPSGIAHMAATYSFTAMANLWHAGIVAIAVLVIPPLLIFPPVGTRLRRNLRWGFVAIAVICWCNLAVRGSTSVTKFVTLRGQPMPSNDTRDMAYIYQRVQEQTKPEDIFILWSIPFVAGHEYWAMSDGYQFGLRLYSNRETWYGYLPFWPLGRPTRQQFDGLCHNLCAQFREAPAHALFLAFDHRPYCDTTFSELARKFDCLQEISVIKAPDGLTARIFRRTY